MDHPTLGSTENAALERAPLTRLRASARAVQGAVAPAGAPHPSLPDPHIWARVFDDASLSAAECAALNAAAQPHSVAGGVLVYAQGDQAQALVAITEGDVALGARLDEGGFRTERHVHGPGWLDVSAGWLGTTRALDARAMSAATLLSVPREAMQQLTERFPGLAQRLITSLAREVHWLAVNTHELMHKDAPARLGAWLLQRCVPTPASANARSGTVQLPMRKRDIASQLAITPETLSRLMRSFSLQGLIEVAGYTVHVRDVPGLRRVAGM